MIPSSAKKSGVICFGEVLWDVFPEFRRVGGAPLNVAFRLNALGVDAFPVSAVGRDALGRELLAQIDSWGIDAQHIQVSGDLSTGTVDVSLKPDGSASYQISQPVAWDHIASTNLLLAWVAQCSAFVFGSLAARHHITRSTLNELLEVAPFVVFDVNLRPPHWDSCTLILWMKQADFIKLNDEELDLVAQSYGWTEEGLEHRIERLIAETRCSWLCVTLGAKGAVLFHDGRIHHHPGYRIEVVDTVGAGDAFMATLLAGILSGQEAPVALDRACAMGALVVGTAGATETITEETLSTFRNHHA